MARRRKNQKLPNGWGSIKFLGKGRRNPYAVHPPTKEFDLNGVPQTPKAICYVDSWIKGFMVLTAYKAGTYTPGYETTLEIDTSVVGVNGLEKLASKILADYSRVKGVNAEIEDHGPTFAEVYEDFFKWKFESDKAKKYSRSSIYSTKAAFNNCTELHNKYFKDLRYNDLQQIVDSCPLKHASLELIVSLFKQMYSYAEIVELCDKNYATHVRINKEDDDEHGVPLSNSDLKMIWKDKEDPISSAIIIMCYSGWRITEIRNIDIDYKNKYFKGGIKTEAGKNRIVPIHSAIYDTVKGQINRFNTIIPLKSDLEFRDMIRKKLISLNIHEDHTPHDFRHTFSKLCEKYKVNENDRKRMMGHSFGQDVTNRVYGHRDLEDLKNEIEKIPGPEYL